MGNRSVGVERIAAERERQQGKLGWTAEHDDDHDDNSLAWAAVCYAAPEPIFTQVERSRGVEFIDPFPWRDGDDARPSNEEGLQQPTDAQRMRLLEKAGALIAAEIDRLLRVKAAPKQEDSHEKGTP